MKPGIEKISSAIEGIDDTYLEKVIRALDSMGFFWLE